MAADLREVERIRESDDDGRPSGARWGWALLGAGIGIVALSAAWSHSSKARATPDTKDPLAALVAEGKAGPKTPSVAGEVSARDVTFPQILSDGELGTTAMAALPSRGSENGTRVVSSAVGQAVPPAPGDRLPVVPLPARDVLDRTNVVDTPKDDLTRMVQARSTGLVEKAEAGHEGAYQLQVSSFQSETEGQKFASELRARGHRSYVYRAEVPGRGTWYRVRIGPFASLGEAKAYRAKFEEKERMTPFLVTPEKSSSVDKSAVVQRARVAPAPAGRSLPAVRNVAARRAEPRVVPRR